MNDLLGMFSLKFLLISLLSQFIGVEGTCRLHFTSNGPKHTPFVLPLSLYNSLSSTVQVTKDSAEFLHPESSDKILYLQNGQQVVLQCLGRNNQLQVTDARSGILSCNNGELDLDGWEVSWSDCSCVGRNRPIYRKTNVKCGEPTYTTATLHSVGWKLANNVFVPQITICFEQSKETTLYVVNKINGRSLAGRVTDGRRPSFKTESLFKSPVARLYKRSSQRKTIGEVFGIEGIESQRGSMFLSRGHLAPDGDYPDLAEQDATYFYSNVVPQWQTINNAHWKVLEESVRELASPNRGRRARELIVYTGTAGVLKLKPKRGARESREVYLNPDQQKLPVPAIIWKAVYDPERREATVVLNTNTLSAHPSLERNLTSLGESVCHLIPWVEWDTSDSSKGLTYCWRVNQLKTLLPYAPDDLRFNLLIQ